LPFLDGTHDRNALRQKLLAMVQEVASGSWTRQAAQTWRLMHSRQRQGACHFRVR
jgi:hypothetical protein